MDNRFRPWRALLFILITLGLLAFTYFLVFRVDLGGSIRVTVRFDSVGTIQSGSPVRQSGVKVGSVSRVALAPDGRGKVDVELSLYQGLTVRTKDRVSIVTGGLLGDQFIDIVPGDPSAPPAVADVPMQGLSGLDLKVLVDGGGDLIKDLSVSSRAIALFLANHSGELDRILADTERGVHHAANAAARAEQLLQKADGLLDKAGGFVDDAREDWDPAAKDVKQTLATLKETAQSLQALVQSLSVPGTLVELLKSPTTAQATSETLENLKSSSRSLKSVTDSLEAALK